MYVHTCMLHICMHTCVCIYICIHVHRQTCMGIYVCMDVHKYACYKYTYMNVYIKICTYADIHEFVMYLCMHINIHKYTDIHIAVHTVISVICVYVFTYMCSCMSAYILCIHIYITNLYVCMEHVCLYALIFKCLPTYIHLWINTFSYMPALSDSCMSVNIFIYIPKCICPYSAYTYTYIYVYMHSSITTYVCV